MPLSKINGNLMLYHNLLYLRRAVYANVDVQVK